MSRQNKHENTNMTRLDEESDINEDSVLVKYSNRDLTDDESEDQSEDESVVKRKK